MINKSKCHESRIWRGTEWNIEGGGIEAGGVWERETESKRDLIIKKGNNFKDGKGLFFLEARSVVFA